MRKLWKSSRIKVTSLSRSLIDLLIISFAIENESLKQVEKLQNLKYALHEANAIVQSLRDTEKLEGSTARLVNAVKAYHFIISAVLEPASTLQNESFRKAAKFLEAILVPNVKSVERPFLSNR